MLLRFQRQLPQSDNELHHLPAVRGLVAHLLLHLGLVLLVLQKGQHLRVLLLEALHVHEVGLGVAAPRRASSSCLTS